MGIFDKLMGSEDKQAIARYRYMLKTAPPETIEQAHAEAFAKLTPQQRSALLHQLSAEVPDAERAGTAAKADPQSLARLATRAEVRRPGTMERAFGGMGRGGGVGGLMAGNFLAGIAGAVIGSAIAQSFLSDSGSGYAGPGDPGSDSSVDAGSDGGDFDGGDFGEV